MEDVVLVAYAAIVARDWDTLHPLLHPYLHWTDRSGRTLRGRRKVLAMLSECDPPGPPSAVELRDEQIYRWQC